MTEQKWEWAASIASVAERIVNTESFDNAGPGEALDATVLIEQRGKTTTLTVVYESREGATLSQNAGVEARPACQLLAKTYRAFHT